MAGDLSSWLASRITFHLLDFATNRPPTDMSTTPTAKNPLTTSECCSWHYTSIALGQLKISQPTFTFSPGHLAQLTGEAASQFAPGHLNPDLNPHTPSYKSYSTGVIIRYF